MSESNMESSELPKVWQLYDSMPFDSWIRAVVEAAGDSTIEKAARLIGINPAEVEAVRRLSILSDQELSLVSEYRPPKTTWFQLASLEFEDLKGALEAIKKCPAGVPPSSVLDTHADIFKSKSIEQKVSALEPEVFFFLAKRAKTYGVLNDKERKVLTGFGSRRSQGKRLSDKQAEWALSMIRDMHARGALKPFPGDDSVVMITLLNELLN